METMRIEKREETKSSKTSKLNTALHDVIPALKNLRADKTSDSILKLGVIPSLADTWRERKVQVFEM